MSEQRPPRGFVAFRRKSVPPKDIIQGFVGIMTGVVSDALDRGGAMDYGIKPVGPGMLVCGPAITLKSRPTDSLARDAALRMAEPGDVLVIATGNYTVTGTWGDLASYNAKGLGLAGMVTDGLCRDIVGIREAGLPVFARGFARTPRSRRAMPRSTCRSASAARSSTRRRHPRRRERRRRDPAAVRRGGPRGIAGDPEEGGRGDGRHRGREVHLANA